MVCDYGTARLRFSKKQGSKKKKKEKKMEEEKVKG
jgi:hypothetical protein